MNKQRLQERIEKCRQILDANPQSQIFAALAEAYRKLGDLKLALDVCNDGLKVHPDYGSAHLVLAKIARDQKRFPDAEKAVFRAIELEGATRSAEIVLSDIYLQTGRFRDAEQILSRLADADPLNKTVRRLRSLVHKAGAVAASRGLTGGGRVAASARVERPEGEASPAPAPALAEEADLKSEPRSEPAGEPDWRGILTALDRYPHLLGKLAVGYDGMVLETDLEVASEAETVAAMAVDLLGAVRNEWPQGNFGQLDQVLVETGESSWWIWPFREFLLVLWCDPQINMGPLRIQLNQREHGPLASMPGGRR